MKRQQLERELSVANMQGEVVRSEQMVRISERNALAAIELAKGDAEKVRLASVAEGTRRKMIAEADAHATKLQGVADAEATRLVGDAKAAAYREGVEAIGGESFTAIQLAQLLGEHKVQLVPEIAVGGGDGGSGGLAGAMIARLLKTSRKERTVTPVARADG